VREQAIRIPVDETTLERLRELAIAERRATTDQAAVMLERAVRRVKMRTAPQVDR